MSNETTALAVMQPEAFNARQLAIITNQIAKGASEDELAYFLEVCKSTGLNPLQKQIYAIMRGPKDNKRMTIQTGIDGYRLIAARTGQLAGIDDPTYDTEDAKHPNKASVTVWRFVAGHRVPFVATARWAEYKPDAPADQMWNKMPYLMLGKCAEALALRKAFPAELSGVYTDEEMAQADSDGPQGYIESAPAMRRPATAPRPPAAPAPQPAPAPARPASNPLFERWQALQSNEPPMRTAKRYNGRWIQMFGHGAPFSDEERATFTAWLEREEERHATAAPAPTARVIDESTGEVLTAEQEPIPFDLRNATIGEIGA